MNKNRFQAFTDAELALLICMGDAFTQPSYAESHGKMTKDGEAVLNKMLNEVSDEIDRRGANPN